jgi:hypothetical protein
VIGEREAQEPRLEDGHARREAVLAAIVRHPAHVAERGLVHAVAGPRHAVGTNAVEVHRSGIEQRDPQ